MPPLDEVIAHYEKQLDEEEESEPEPDVVDVPTGDEPVVELGSQTEPAFDMSQFSGVLSKDLKELCRKLGFSPKGNKKELVSRLLNHPQYNTVDQLLAECKKEPEPKPEPES